MPNGDFLTLLGRSLQTAKDHLLPSSSVTLRLANNQAGDFKELVKRPRPRLRPRCVR